LSTILVAIDGSDESREVVSHAIKLAKQLSARILLLHVIPKLTAPPGFASYVKGERIEMAPEAAYGKMVGEEILRKFGEEIQKAGVSLEKLVEFGDPADVITGTAESRNVSYVVVGIVGLRGIRKIAGLGSVARRVIENSVIPVITVPHKS